ncbi:MAG: hypothetical protein R3D44_02025 [Hyphomicrobiaceae bacterium]
MTERHRTSREDKPVFPWAAFMQAPGVWGAVGQTAQTAEPLMRGAARAQLEFSSLVGARMRAWAGIPEALSRCRTPIDLVQAQAAFWQTAARDYGSASRHVMAAWGSMLPGGFRDASSAEVEPRDFITFPEASDSADEPERRRPGASRRAA